jgi:hypothetical protein
MGSSAVALEASLVASVQDSLGLLLYDNARFMGERLVASFGSEVRARSAAASLTSRRPDGWQHCHTRHQSGPGVHEACWQTLASGALCVPWAPAEHAHDHA